MVSLKPGMAKSTAHIVGVVDLPAIVGDDLLPRHDRVRQDDLLCGCRAGGGWRKRGMCEYEVSRIQIYMTSKLIKSSKAGSIHLCKEEARA